MGEFFGLFVMVGEEVGPALVGLLVLVGVEVVVGQWVMGFW